MVAVEVGRHDGVQPPDVPPGQVGGGGQPAGAGMGPYVRPSGVRQQAEGFAAALLLRQDGVAVPYVNKVQAQHGSPALGVLLPGGDLVLFRRHVVPAVQRIGHRQPH